MSSSESGSSNMNWFFVLFSLITVAIFGCSKTNDYQEIRTAFDEASFGSAIGYPRFKFAYRDSVKSVHMNPLGMHLNRWWKIGRK